MNLPGRVFVGYLELRFRSSQATEVTSDANFGIKELWHLFDSSAALNLKFLRRPCSDTDRNFKFAALVTKLPRDEAELRGVHAAYFATGFLNRCRSMPEGN